MKRSKAKKIKRAPAPYTKYNKSPYKYPEWIDKEANERKKRGNSVSK